MVAAAMATEIAGYDTTAKGTKMSYPPYGRDDIDSSMSKRIKDERTRLEEKCFLSKLVLTSIKKNLTVLCKYTAYKTHI